MNYDFLSAGDLLISPPSMKDLRFDKAVLLLTNHSGSSMAFCLNKPTNHRLAEIIDCHLTDRDNVELYWGGPVAPQTVWMLHDKSWSHPETIEINDEWSMTSHIDMFKNLNDQYRPNRYRIFFGCSTWAPGQLQNEIEGTPPWNPNHSWLILNDPDPEWLLTTPIDNLWTESAELCSKQAVDQWMP